MKFNNRTAVQHSMVNADTLTGEFCEILNLGQTFAGLSQCGPRPTSGYVETGEVVVYFSACVVVSSPARVFIEVNGVSKVSAGYRKIDDTKWIFESTDTISDGDTVRWRYVGGLDSIVDCDEGDDIADDLQEMSIPIYNKAAAVPVFDALQPDPTTGVMTPVLKGIGTVSDARGSSYWAKDVDGVYHEYAIGELAWGGGRVTGTVGNRVVYGTDAGGSPLPERPYVVSGIAAENRMQWARDLTQWSQTALVSSALDAVGITAEANSATTVEDNQATYQYVYITPSSVDVAVDTSLVLSVGKSGTGILGIQISNPASELRIDPSDGSTHYSNQGGITDAIAIDDGAFWKVVLTFTSAVGSPIVYLHPARALTLTGAPNATATGVQIFDAVQLYSNTPHSLAISLPPIFTEGVSISNAPSVMTFDPANVGEVRGSLYMEASISASPQDIVDLGILPQRLLNSDFPVLQSNGGGQIRFTADTVNVNIVSPWSANEIMQMAIRFGDATMRSNVNGVWSAEAVYGGVIGANGLFDGRINRWSQSILHIRKLQFYDSDDESIIDGLMS